MTEEQRQHITGIVEETEVYVVPYDPRWPTLYWEEAKCIQETLGDMVVIEHLGAQQCQGLMQNQ
jgi:GrpB-like predicted nucleotidyltransferase (UPF0157 family)